MRFFSALVAASAWVLAVSALVPPLSPTFGNVKRAVPVPPSSVNVQLQNFTLDDSFFSGSIYIKNIAFVKLVTVLYSNASDFFPLNASEQSIPASFNDSISGTDFETWVFTGLIGPQGICHFYLRYDVSGQTFFDNNGTHNYDVDATLAAITNSTNNTNSTSSSPTVAKNLSAGVTSSPANFRIVWVGLLLLLLMR
ncbi:hypothetical protein K438DRAFT_1946263 [Mycena galopus ATCC 62051]|nr:hypothetical protein K438DRAFT_1946263 [Mycena galopus ATCC 62051]